MMKYDLTKTLKENFDTMNEQDSEMRGSIYSRVGDPKKIEASRLEGERKKEEEEAAFEIQWRSGCGPNGEYYDNVIEPPRTPAGREGILRCCCYYPVPATGFENAGEIRGMYIPRTSKLEFFDPVTLSDYVDGWLKMFEKEGYSIKKEWLLKKVSEVFPMGTVSKITSYDGTTYKTWIRHSKEENGGIFDKFYFMGYYTNDGKRNPEDFVGDDRNQYQKIVDEWGGVIQWTAVIVTALSGFLTGGATLPLAAELAIEFGIGLAVGLREIEKGNDISGAFTIMMGLLPALKYLPSFRGVDPKHLDEISEAFQKSGLTTASHPSEYVAFYNRLSKPAKKTFDRVIRGGDGRSMRMISGQLSKEAADRLPYLLESGFMNMWRLKPKLFKEIPFFKRLWVKELGTGVVTSVASLLAQYNCPNCSKSTSDKLTEEMKDKLDGIYENVRAEIQYEIGYFLLSNPEQAEQILDSPEFVEAVKNGKGGIGNYEGNISSGMINNWGSTLEQTSKSLGIDWTPPSDLFESQNKKIPAAELQKLTDSGWVKMDDLPLGEEYSKIDLFNGEYYVLPNIKNTTPVKDSIK